jgi:hypothetical protein
MWKLELTYYLPYAQQIAPAENLLNGSICSSHSSQCHCTTVIAA